MAYWRLLYHLVWATWKREPLLTAERRDKAYGAMLGKAQDLKVTVHAIGGTETHVHLVVSVPPKLAVAYVVAQMKGRSSHYTSAEHGPQSDFRWQEAYGALTFGERSMQDIVAYVQNQEAHHRANDIRPAFEDMGAQDATMESSGWMTSGDPIVRLNEPG